jgi:glycerol-3-phosphate acyltransferase PlsY
VSLPLFALAFGASWPILGFTIGAAAAIVLLHRSNIRRLLKGEELRASIRIPRGGRSAASP